MFRPSFSEIFSLFFVLLSLLLQMKRWSELPGPLRLYFCFTVASLLVLLGLTSSSIYKERKDTEVTDEDNYTVSLIQLLGICESHTELYIFIEFRSLLLFLIN